MSAFVAGPLAVADASSYVDYNATVLAAMRQLATEGRLADVSTLDDFIDLSARIRRAVFSGAAAAGGRNESEFVLTVPMTRAEHLMMNAMGPTLQTVLEIATMRGTVDTSPPPEAFRFMRVLATGRFES